MPCRKNGGARGRQRKARGRHEMRKNAACMGRRNGNFA